MLNARPGAAVKRCRATWPTLAPSGSVLLSLFGVGGWVDLSLSERLQGEPCFLTSKRTALRFFSETPVDSHPKQAMVQLLGSFLERVEADTEEPAR